MDFFYTSVGTCCLSSHPSKSILSKVANLHLNMIGRWTPPSNSHSILNPSQNLQNTAETLINALITSHPDYLLVGQSIKALNMLQYAQNSSLLNVFQIMHAVFKPRVHHHSLCDCYGSGSIPQATFYLFAHLCVWSHYSCTYLYPTSCLSTCCKELFTNLPEQLLPYQPHYLLLTTSLLIFLLTGNQPYRMRQEVTTLFFSKFTWTSPSHGERRDTVLRAVW